MTKLVIETALEEEMSEHLAYGKHAMEGRNRGNSRNGKRAKTVLTDSAGAVEIEVPMDRESTFAPVSTRLGPRRAGRPEAAPRARIGVDLDGRKEILAMSAGDGDGESAKYWMAVLTDIRNRGC